MSRISHAVVGARRLKEWSSNQPSAIRGPDSRTAMWTPSIQAKTEARLLMFASAASNGKRFRLGYVPLVIFAPRVVVEGSKGTASGR